MSEELDTLILAELLSAQPGFASGNALADELGVSRVSIWSHVDSLKKDGIEIEAIRNRGYRLKAFPSSLHPSVLEAMLLKERVTSDFSFFESVDSTNSEAERQLAIGCETPLVIAAGTQTQGRGRLGRSWYSQDKGNLYLSFVFRPQLAPARMQRFTLWIGLSLCHEINRSQGLPVMIKWPNDLYLDGRKVVGILTEARIDSDHMRDLVIGCGININPDLSLWPDDLRSRATSLSEHAGRPLEIHSLAAGLIRAGLSAYDRFVDGNHLEDFNSLWECYNMLHREPVVVQQGNSEFTGKAIGLNASGALEVELSSGEKRSFQAGDVSLTKQ